MTTPTYILRKERKEERKGAREQGRKEQNLHVCVCVYQSVGEGRECMCVWFWALLEMFSSYFLPCLLRAHDFYREMLLCDREEGVGNE
jgi:hypothetical protein